MRTLVIIAFILIFNLISRGQDTSNFSIQFKLHPLAAINIDRPSIIGSIEFVFKNKIGIEYGYGQRYIDYMFGQDWNLDTTKLPFSGHTQFVELTIYRPFKNNYKTDNYIGITFRYFDDLVNAQKYYFPNNVSSNTSQSPKLDCYSIKRNVQILSFKAGFIYYMKKFSFDSYFEVGIRSRYLSLINNEFDPNRDLFPNGLWPWEQPFNGYLPSFSIGLKINYKMHL